MKVSVIIPTKNEPYINELIRDIHEELKNFEHEVIVVDLSDIPPVLNNAKLVLQQSKGLGNAVIEGLEYASGDVIVLMDGDGSHRPKDILKLLNAINEYDIVIGSRFVPGGKTKDKTHRRIMSWLYRNFASFLLNLDLKDSMSGFSAIKRDVYYNLDLNPLGFKINTEIVYKGKKKGYGFKEVSIIFEKRKAGISSAGLGESLRIIRYMVELRFGLR